MLHRCMNRRRSGVTSSNAVGKLVLSRGMKSRICKYVFIQRKHWINKIPFELEDNPFKRVFYFTDLKTYHIHVDRTGGVNGTDGSGGQGEASDVGCDLLLTSTEKRWRPGAGGFAFGDDGYFTWLCAVPRGNVTGTLFYDGKEHQVTGAGYHDHQWGNVKHNSTWDHWIWGRQDFGDYCYRYLLGIQA